MAAGQMTQEEFEAHLLVALHGPNACKIASRVAEIVASDAEIEAELGKLGDAFSAKVHDPISNLAMLALAQVKRPTDPSHRDRLVSVQLYLLSELRDWVSRGAADVDPMPAGAARVFADLGVPV